MKPKGIDTLREQLGKASQRWIVGEIVCRAQTVVEGS